MPKLWDDTIEAHRRAVRDATLDATAALVAAHGLPAVTMSRIARETGIGRATLYKYFPDVQAILLAWHRRHVQRHLEDLVAARDAGTGTRSRLEAVLRAYASVARQRPGSELAAVLHRGEHVVHAQQQLREFVGDLLADGVRAGELRDDVPLDELTQYVLHALAAASTLSSDGAVRRLVEVTLDGLRHTG